MGKVIGEMVEQAKQILTYKLNSNREKEVRKYFNLADPAVGKGI